MKSVNKSAVFHFSPITVDKEEETCRQRRAVSGGGVLGGRNQRVCLCKRVTERLPLLSSVSLSGDIFLLVVNERAKCDGVTQSLIISSTAKQNTRWDDQGARR